MWNKVPTLFKLLQLDRKILLGREGPRGPSRGGEGMTHPEMILPALSHPPLVMMQPRAMEGRILLLGIPMYLEARHLQVVILTRWVELMLSRMGMMATSLSQTGLPIWRGSLSP
jgi:hypothetical protein